MTNTSLKVIQVKPGEALPRPGIEAQLIAQAKKDPEFKQALINETTEVMALAVEEALGIDIRPVVKVEILQETPNKLYLVLPVCHKGCEASCAKEAPPEFSGSCHLCGLPKPQIGSDCTQTYSDINDILTRKKIEFQLIAKTQIDPGFKQQLFSQPTATFINAVEEILGGRRPEFLENVTEVHVVEETPFILYIVLPFN